MFKRLRKNKKAQNTAEYAILISLVVAAIVAMQVFVQRGFQGRLRDAVQGYLVTQTNGLGGQDSAQYEPYYLSSNYQVTRAESEAQLLNTGTVNASLDSFRKRATGGFQQSTFNLTTDAPGTR